MLNRLILNKYPVVPNTHLKAAYIICMQSKTEVIPVASIGVLSPLVKSFILFSLLIFKHKGGLNIFKLKTEPKATKTLKDSTPNLYSLLFLLNKM